MNTPFTPLAHYEKCFACDRQLRKKHEPYVVRVMSETTTVHVGRDCYAKVCSAGLTGYQPPLGGPRLIDRIYPVSDRP